MRSFNLRVVKRFWGIAHLYWFGDEKRGALGLLVLLGLLLLAYTQGKVILNAQQGEWISALASGDGTRFWNAVLVALVGIFIVGILNSLYGYLREIIGIYWRRWLTHHLLDQYFADRSFYTVGHFSSEIDNPDQRIAEDISIFCQKSMQFFLNIAEASFVVISFSIVLWSIYKPLVAALVIYATSAYLITIGFYGRKLTKLNFEQLKKEADFRFGLVRIRENAESIAFYNAISRENNRVKQLFVEVFKNLKRLTLWSELYLNVFKYQFGYLPWVIPGMILAPHILSGQIELGKLSESAGAFGNIAFSVNAIMYEFGQYTKFAASIDRLSIFYTYISKSEQILHPNNNKITLVEAQNVSIKSLTLNTPNYQRKLFENFSVDMQPGQGVLVMGKSGCGKSSLLRALAGLWTSGSGKIHRPALEDILFLPQKPYMILGNLRDQLLYPKADINLSDDELFQFLSQVNLSDLSSRFGGFDTEQDWGEVLSLGEQQRLSFTRILANKPRYVILDEATSALDVENEANLYRLLLETGITYISVGHRPTLKKYHQFIVTL